MRLIGQVGTVEQWWALYSHIVRLQDIPPHRDVHLFKKGIKPMWEDPANKKGGKWVIFKMLNVKLYLLTLYLNAGHKT